MPLGSQTDTDSLICITPTVLKEIRLELTEFDFVRDTLLVHAHKDSLIQVKLGVLTNIITAKDAIITQKDSMIVLKESEIVFVEDELKLQKKKNRKHVAIHIGAGVLFVLLLIVAL